MIGRLSGTLLEVDANTLLIDVGGVGYELEVSASVLQRAPLLGEPIDVHTHFVVREDAQLLYGFMSKNERGLFRAFIKISGVGPKLGLALISSLDPQSLSQAVRTNDVSMLTKVPGVGKKTAERLMVELKNRIEELVALAGTPLELVAGARAPVGVTSEAEDALVALGYRPNDAATAVGEAFAELEAKGDGPTSPQDVVRLALRGFGRSAS